MSKARRVKKMAKRRDDVLRRVCGDAGFLFTAKYIRFGDVVIVSGSTEPSTAINLRSTIEILHSKPCEQRIVLPYQVI